MLGGFFATNVGAAQMFGLEGWRCAFHAVALVSVSTSLLVMWLAVDPRRRAAVRPPLFPTLTTSSGQTSTPPISVHL
jgi:predicted MFS family arabinose efflux permease